jgi:hypothetical protein
VGFVAKACQFEFEQLDRFFVIHHSRRTTIDWVRRVRFMGDAASP